MVNFKIHVFVFLREQAGAEWHTNTALTGHQSAPFSVQHLGDSGQCEYWNQQGDSGDRESRADKVNPQRTARDRLKKNPAVTHHVYFSPDGQCVSPCAAWCSWWWCVMSWVCSWAPWVWNPKQTPRIVPARRTVAAPSSWCEHWVVMLASSLSSHPNRKCQSVLTVSCPEHLSDLWPVDVTAGGRASASFSRGCSWSPCWCCSCWVGTFTLWSVAPGTMGSYWRYIHIHLHTHA